MGCWVLQAVAPVPPLTVSVPLHAPRSSPATATVGLALDATPPPLPRGAPTAPQVPTVWVAPGGRGPQRLGPLEGVAPVEGSGSPAVVPRLSVPDLVSNFIQCLGVARTPSDIAAVDWNRVPSAKLARSNPSAVSVGHANRRVSVYPRQPMTFLCTRVRNSQGIEHWGAGVRCKSDPRRPRSSQILPPCPRAAELVELLATIGLSDAKLNRIRVFSAWR